MREQNRKNPRGILRAILTVVMLLSLGMAAFLVAGELKDAWKAHTLKNELKDLYGSGDETAWRWPGMTVAHAEEAEDAAQPGEEEALQPDQPLEIHEDFQALYEKNSDLVGWLTAGEDIDYPVVQRDNEYYLSHDYYGGQDRNGTLFLNEFNVLEPRDSVLLIHGHNMKSGAMFGKLPRYEKESYMRAHPLITFRSIYDAEEVHYVPVAAFNASMKPGAAGYFDVTPMNFETAEEQQAFLGEISARSLWESPVEVTAEDELIVLITCSYQHEDGRFMLYCRKLREHETPEEMRTQFAP